MRILNLRMRKNPSIEGRKNLQNVRKETMQKPKGIEEEKKKEEFVRKKNKKLANKKKKRKKKMRPTDS
jgi:hypothetical protein